MHPEHTAHTLLHKLLDAIFGEEDEGHDPRRPCLLDPCAGPELVQGAYVYDLGIADGCQRPHLFRVRVTVTPGAEAATLYARKHPGAAWATATAIAYTPTLYLEADQARAAIADALAYRVEELLF